MMLFKLFLLLFLFKDSLQVAPHVEIPSGKIEGFIDESITGRQFYSFEGIPYAEPPLGENRFKPPVPKKPWKGCLKANTQYVCIQEKSLIFPSESKQTIQGSEDCLYVNVYTPKLNGNFDVLVYIHGGAFVLGSSDMIAPDILIDRDVVLVSLNYRLGALGFLSTEDDVLPGNDGLKDQVFALKWVKENIKLFGGNPHSITIIGTSAGGASVHFHTLSAKSKGLFHKAISSSGCMLNPWTILENPREKTKQLARIVGCEMEDSKEIVDCLRERSAKQIVAAISKLQPWEHTPFSPLAPVVDVWSSDPVFPDHPYKLLKGKKVNDVPWILAQMAVEGHCSGFEYYSEKTLEHLDQHWNDLMPHVLHYNFTVGQSDLKTVGEKMRKEYIGEEHLTFKNLNKLLTLIGDRLFNSDFDKAVRLHAAAIKSPVYYYWFNYRGFHSISELITKTNHDLGASHGDDLLYISNGMFNCFSTESDKAMVKVMLDMYLSFAKEGKPSINKVEWTPVSQNVEDQIRYLKMDSPTAIFDEKIREFGNRKFWDSLPFQENENFNKAALQITPSVYTPLGKIEGFADTSLKGRTFYSFNGIPYAEPPTGPNRFKEPIAVKPWKGVLKANAMYECLQYLSLPNLNKSPNPGSEDCLYLNVHSPNLNGNMDVFVHIHGGCFAVGTGGWVQPHILMERDVVVVTINYRLGLLGFLSTEDDVVPGNNGLKDQILALRWIKENIQYFGGNSSSITITGTSAGGASVHFHTLSSKSKGLFHKAISSSGTMLNPWALMENSLSKTKQLAELVGCNKQNVKEMVDCLRERPGQQIVAQFPKFLAWHSTPLCPFAPVFDIWSADPVFPQHPYELLKEKKVNDVPWMLGEMAVEGHCNGFGYYSEETLKYLDQHWNELMTHILGYNSTVEPSDLQTIGKKIREEYLGTEVPTISNLKKLLRIFSDRLFSADFDRSLRMHSAAISSPVYYYLFNYRGAHSYTELTTKTNEDFGAAHGDDLMYITNSLSNSQSTEQDRSMSKLIVDIYLSFARNGKPETNQVRWEPVSKMEMDPIKYLKINSPSSLVSGESTQLGNRKFWDSLPFHENKNFKEDKNLKMKSRLQ